MKKRQKILWLGLTVLLLAAVLLGGMGLLLRQRRQRVAVQAYQELAETTNAAEQRLPEVEEPERLLADQEAPFEEQPEEPLEKPLRDPLRDPLVARGIEIPEKSLDWDELHEINGDIYAWIYVPDTTVDYPVLQHPTDNSYYLNYNLDGSRGYPGCIYTEDFNSKDFTDPHTVLYGHNLKDKTMFSSLHNFESGSMFAEDHYIYIYTPEKTFVYLVFAAYEYPSIHLLDNFDTSNEYVYEQYLRDVQNVTNTNARVAIVRSGVEVTKEDRIVTLSTCTSDHNASFRFLVVGVLLNP